MNFKLLKRIMTVKEKIIGTLRATGRENIEQVIEYMGNNGFFTKSCHRHHHYRGGLADHAWQTYQIALQNNPNGIDEQSIAICALLHDFCNCGGMTDQVGHGRRSAGMLKELGLHLSYDEFLAVRFHMSLHTHISHPLYNDARRCALRRLIHTSDTQSAQKRTGAEFPAIDH